MTTWTGGTMSGSGITNALGGLSLGASGDTGDIETLAGRTLINAGTGVWYGPDTLTQEEEQHLPELLRCHPGDRRRRHLGRR